MEEETFAYVIDIWWRNSVYMFNDLQRKTWYKVIADRTGELRIKPKVNWYLNPERKVKDVRKNLCSMRKSNNQK